MASIGGSPDSTMATASAIDSKNATATAAGKKTSESNQQAALERTMFKMAETNTNTVAQDGAKGATSLQSIS
ncbi:MAG: hypothetical protein WED00_13625 [Aquisalimonadaceae bacterium]